MVGGFKEGRDGWNDPGACRDPYVWTTVYSAPAYSPYSARTVLCAATQRLPAAPRMSQGPSNEVAGAAIPASRHCEEAISQYCEAVQSRGALQPFGAWPLVPTVLASKHAMVAVMASRDSATRRIRSSSITPR